MNLTKKNKDVSYFCMHFQMFTILWRAITSHHMNNMNYLKFRNWKRFIGLYSLMILQRLIDLQKLSIIWILIDL